MKATMTKTILLVALAVCSAFAADEASKLSPAAQQALDAAEKAVAKNRQAYDAANQTPLAAAEKVLKAEQDRLGKAGKLEEALAVKKALESFKAEVVAKVDAAAGKAAGGDLLGNDKQDQTKVIIGKWKSEGNVYELTDANKVINTWKEDWSWTLDNGKITITRAINGSDPLVYYILTVKGKNQLIGKFVQHDNAPVTFDRVKP